MAQSRQVQAKGIILAVYPQGEYGRRCVILTDIFGKITAFAGGAAKAGSGMTGTLRPFAAASFVLSRGRSAWNIRSLKLIDSFAELPADPGLFMRGTYVLEAAAYMSAEGMDIRDAKDMLNLIYVTLEALRACQGMEAPRAPEEREPCGQRESASGISALSPDEIISIYELRMLVIDGEYTRDPEIRESRQHDTVPPEKLISMWRGVIESPLRALYTRAAEYDIPVRKAFAESAGVLFKRQIPHNFRSWSLFGRV